MLSDSVMIPAPGTREEVRGGDIERKLKHVSEADLSAV
jgi:hypothetical protein